MSGVPNNGSSKLAYPVSRAQSGNAAEAAKASGARQRVPDRHGSSARSFGLCLSFPPPAFRRYRRVAGIGRVKSGGYRRWLLDSRARLLAALPKHIGGPVSVQISFRGAPTVSAAVETVMPVVQFLVAYGLIDGDRTVDSLSVKRLRGKGAAELRVQVKGL